MRRCLFVGTVLVNRPTPTLLRHTAPVHISDLTLCKFRLVYHARQIDLPAITMFLFFFCLFFFLLLKQLLDNAAIENTILEFIESNNLDFSTRINQIVSLAIQWITTILLYRTT